LHVSVLFVLSFFQNHLLIELPDRSKLIGHILGFETDDVSTRVLKSCPWASSSPRPTF
jgi:hypothetical protein